MLIFCCQCPLDVKYVPHRSIFDTRLAKISHIFPKTCSVFVQTQSLLVQELEAIKARVKEMEEEAEKLKDMQKEIEGSLNLSMSPTTAGTVIFCTGK